MTLSYLVNFNDKYFYMYVISILFSTHFKIHFPHIYMIIFFPPKVLRFSNVWMKKNKFIFYTISIVKYFSYEMLLFSIRGFRPYPVLLYHYIVSYRRDEKFQGDGKLKIYEFEKNLRKPVKKTKTDKKQASLH